MNELQEWIGRSDSVHEHIAPTPVAAMQALLDQPARAQLSGQPLPPLWHWLYFLPLHRQSELGPDGHALRGGFLPPVPLPRRMWAGSRFEFRTPIRLGDAVTRTSTIEAITSKAGRSGQLVFVKVRHELSCNGAAVPALIEHHDIVYREAKRPGEGEPSPVAAGLDADWQRSVTVDAVMLFRYSALTFNGHRIHYDRTYAIDVEGYPGLVVHGPFIASLLLDLLGRHVQGAEVAAFRFRAVRPSFDGQVIMLSGQRQGQTVKLWAQDHHGWLTMEAEATLT